MIDNWSLLQLIKGDVQANKETINNILGQAPYKAEQYRTKRQLMIMIILLFPWLWAWSLHKLIEIGANITFRSGIVDTAGIFLFLLGIGVLVMAVRICYCVFKADMLEYEVYDLLYYYNYHVGYDGEDLIKKVHEQFQENWRDT